MLVHWESTRSLLKVVRVSSSSFFTFNNKPMFFPSPSLSAHPFGSSVPTSDFLFSSFRTLPPQSSSVLKLDGTVTSPPLPLSPPPPLSPSILPPSRFASLAPSLGRPSLGRPSLRPSPRPAQARRERPLPQRRLRVGPREVPRGDRGGREVVQEGERGGLHPTTLLCLQFLTTLSLLPLP